MTYEQAFAEARALCQTEGVPVVLVHDPLGRDDWESVEEAYSYATQAAAAYIFRHSSLVVTFIPAPQAVTVLPASPEAKRTTRPMPPVARLDQPSDYDDPQQ